jgi:zinc/manganese transport system substrate-binding protein
MASNVRTGLLIVTLLLTASGALAAPVRITVSNAVYADLAHQIGDPGVAVTLIKAEKSEGSGARGFPPSDVVMCGGTKSGTSLCEQARRSATPPVVIEAVTRTAGGQDEPALPWYDTKTVSALCGQLAAELSRRLPAQAPRIATNLMRTQTALRNIDRKREETAHLYQGTDVIVTDQLSRDFIDPFRFRIVDDNYLKALSRNGTPSAATVAALNDAIQRRKASLLVYDQSSATTPAVKDLIAAANDTGMPAVGLRETAPRGLHYQQWLLRQINAVHGALNQAAP